MTDFPRIAVIGAGLAGLSCASLLQQMGMSVTVFDKSRGPGGRMSTRSGEDWQCDHGAQYFTARHPDFQDELRHWQHDGVAAVWTPRLAVLGNADAHRLDPALERYVGVPGMSAPAGYRPFDETRIALAVRDILLALGEDPDRDGLADTPRRVARAYGEIFSGIRRDPTRHLRRTFAHEGGAGDLVVVRGIEIFSMCEHHLLPFMGRANVGYLPGDGKVVGLSKIARMVDDYARRPQIQERLCAQIADAMMVEAGARGAAVVIEGEHMFMRMRGISKHGADMLTTAIRGVLETDHAMRATTLDSLRKR